MSEILDRRAQVVKLARLLGVEPEEIAYLEKVDTDALHAFRDQLVDVFFGQEDGALKRFATVGNMLPSSVIASLTKEAVGPVLAARITGLIDPKQAVSVVDKLPIPFVTDIAVELDPRRVEPVVGGLPQKTISALAIELVKRHEYVTMGDFISFADAKTLGEIFEHATDLDLLQIAFVTDDKVNLAGGIAELSDERLSSIMGVATREGHWPEAIDLLRHVPDDEYFRLIELVSKERKETLDAMVAATATDNLWEVVTPALARMENPSRAFDALLRADDAAIRGFADAVIIEDDWSDMHLLLEKLSKKQLELLHTRLRENDRAEQFAPVEELFVA